MLFRSIRALGRSVRKYVVDQPSTFIFRREIYGIWLLGLTLLVAFTAQIAATMNGNAKDNLWNYSLPLSANFYFVIGVFILVCCVLFPKQTTLSNTPVHRRCNRLQCSRLRTVCRFTARLSATGRPLGGLHHRDSALGDLESLLQWVLPVGNVTFSDPGNCLIYYIS